MFRVGLIVNPLAGMGGPAGLKGSDGVDIQRLALSLGVQPASSDRAVRALESVRSVHPSVQVVTGAASLGEQQAIAAGFTPEVVYRAFASGTTAHDTRNMVTALCVSGVDIILFAGGDGTARDVCAVAPADQLVLGIPTGVKMHSGVFAITPGDVGAIIKAVAYGRASGRRAEVVDIDEEARRRGQLRSRLYGALTVPNISRMQSGKRGSEVSPSGAIEGIAAEIAARVSPEALCIFGPGTTVQSIGAALGHDLSLLGVDVVKGGKVVGYDVDARSIDHLVSSERLHVVVSPIGGQGIVLGRGNQQIHERILERLAPDDLIVACTPEKLGSLAGAPLRIDSPTAALNLKFAGVKRVVVGLRQEAVVRVC